MLVDLWVAYSTLCLRMMFLFLGLVNAVRIPCIIEISVSDNKLYMYRQQTVSQADSESSRQQTVSQADSRQ